MSKNNKKLTLHDMITRAKQAKADKFKVEMVYIPSLEGEIEIKKIDKMRYYKLVSEMQDIVEEKGGLTDIIRKSAELISVHCAIFREQKLMDAIEAETPIDLIVELLSDKEMQIISDSISSMYGVDISLEVREDIKN